MKKLIENAKNILNEEFTPVESKFKNTKHLENAAKLCVETLQNLIYDTSKFARDLDRDSKEYKELNLEADILLKAKKIVEKYKNANKLFKK